MAWDDEYAKHKQLWGKGPSELALAAVSHLKKNKPDKEILSVLDIGCGYGRDAFYFLENLDCEILGIDISEKAIEIASNTAIEKGTGDIRFECRDFREPVDGNYDIVYFSNLYQLLDSDTRKDLKNAAAKALKPQGLLFLSTLSVSDPEHYGKGEPIPGEPNSFYDGRYLHLCTREELMEDFSFLDIREFYEHEYDEPRATGETHHHISWILMGETAGI